MGYQIHKAPQLNGPHLYEIGNSLEREQSIGLSSGLKRKQDIVEFNHLEKERGECNLDLENTLQV
jgi:hypothetical protein